MATTTAKPPKSIDEMRKALPKRERRIVPAAVGAIEVRSDAGGPPKIAMTIPYNADSQELGGFLGSPGFVERIRPGAFKKSIAQRSGAKAERNKDVVSLWNHDPNWVLGRQVNGTLTFHDGEDTLEAVVQMDAEDSMHQHFLRRVERGDVQGSSFGFETVKDEWDRLEDGSTIRTLIEVKLFDVSPVTFPAYPTSEAQTRAVLDVASVRAGVNLDELADILQHMKNGKVPKAAERKFGEWLKRLQAMVPDPDPDIELHKLKLGRFEKLLGPEFQRATKSVDGTDHPMSDFAYHADPTDIETWHLPIFDADHAQNALSRWNQTDMPDGAEKQKAYNRVLAACHKFGIDTEEFEKEHAPRGARTYTRPSDGKTYDTLDACVADNGWADDPEAYCMSIKTGPGPTD